jgi:hypothetical protein
MSQQQGEPAGDAPRGPYRHDVAASAAPDYGRSSSSGYEPEDYRYSPPDQDRDSSQNYGGYGYDQGGSHQPGYGHAGYENYGQTYGQYGSGQPGCGYEQPGYGYDPGGHRQLSASLTLDDGSDRHYQLREGSTVVGRGQDAQFRLPDTGVSRRHMEITWDGRTAVLADLGSTNGTTVNGTPVQTWQLVDGDVVRVGQSQLVFRTQG